MDLPEIKRDLRTLSSKDVYRKYLLGQDVWFFKEFLKNPNPYKMYDEFKFYISNGLGVHFNNIAVIGSAKAGYSFAPYKKLRAFKSNSDLDIVIVSDKHFNLFWNAYREMYYRQVPIPEYIEVTKSVFKRFVSLKAPTEKHEEIKKWVKTVDPFVKDLQMFFGINQDINYRIYESWDDVEKYHLFGINQLKNYISNNSEKEVLLANIINSLIQNENGNDK